MLALGPTQALEGVASTASTVTYTISGLLMNDTAPPVAQGYKVLAQGQLASSAASIYEPSSSQSAEVSSIHLFNTSTATKQTVKLYAEGTTSAHQLVTLVLQPLGWASYDAEHGWQVYGSSGAQVQTAPLFYAATLLVKALTLTSTAETAVMALELEPGTWLVHERVLAELTTTETGHYCTWLGPKAATTATAYVPGAGAYGRVAGYFTNVDQSLFALVTVTTSTTVYLNFVCDEAHTVVKYESVTTSAPNATGLLAIKIG